jgi:catechol 2,3-dioxygenase-like lactoylglutathione lyase family enzyme
MRTLSAAPLIAFLATADGARCLAFYRDVLGLRLVDDGAFALEFDVGGTMLRIQKVEALTPHAFIALGWQVGDIAAQVAELVRAGVTFERFAGLEQDDAGVWTAPSGARIAWFRDPDGNVLSLTEFP